MEDICDSLLTVVTSSLQSELEHVSKTHALLLKSLMIQAERSGAELAIDTAQLENKELLDGIAYFEAILQNPDTAQRALGGAGKKMTGGKLPVLGSGAPDNQVLHENKALKDEVEELKRKTRTLGEQVTESMRVRSDLNAKIEDLQAQLLSAEGQKLSLAAKDQQMSAQLEDKDGQVAAAQREIAAAQEALEAEKRALEQAKQTAGADEAALLAAKNESAARVQELKMTLMKKEEALKDTQDKAQQKVAGSTQMQNMRKMLQKKNDVIAALRTELRKYRPDEPADVED